MIPILFFIVFIVAIYFTVQPFLLENIEIPEEVINPKNLSKKRRLVNIFKQIRETEFEYDMGIISDEDFNRTNNELKLEASNLIENSKEISTSQKCSNCKNCHSKLEENDKFCSQCGVGVS